MFCKIKSQEKEENLQINKNKENEFGSRITTKKSGSQGQEERCEGSATSPTKRRTGVPEGFEHVGNTQPEFRKECPETCKPASEGTTSSAAFEPKRKPRKDAHDEIWRDAT